jgi:hypothetical protein
MAGQAPYCKTSAEAFAPGAVFPNGYRRVGDERSFEQKLIDLQNECFRRMDAQDTTIAKLTADLSAERAARLREAAEQERRLSQQNAAHAKAIAALRVELAVERRAKDEAVSRITAQRSAAFSTATKRIDTVAADHQDLRCDFEALIHSAVRSQLINAEPTKSVRNHLVAKHNGPIHVAPFLSPDRLLTDS